MFGTDLPGTRARRPFAPADAALVREVAGEAALGAQRAGVLSANCGWVRRGGPKTFHSISVAEGCGTF